MASCPWVSPVPRFERTSSQEFPSDKKRWRLLADGQIPCLGISSEFEQGLFSRVIRQKKHGGGLSDGRTTRRVRWSYLPPTEIGQPTRFSRFSPCLGCPCRTSSFTRERKRERLGRWEIYGAYYPYFMRALLDTRCQQSRAISEDRSSYRPPASHCSVLGASR